MKKHGLGILVLVTCIFAAFTAGFCTGRNLNRAPVRILQAQIQAAEAAATESETEAETNTGPTAPAIININTATAAEFEALPGIGPVLAERIVAYREQNGSFQAPEELTKVKGIGQAKLEEIYDLITAGG